MATCVASGLIILFAAAAGAGVSWWLFGMGGPRLVERWPGMDGRPRQGGASGAQAEADVRIGEHYRKSDAEASDWPGHWPRFRGADFDNVCKDDIALSSDWSNHPPAVRWSLPVGEGHAAPAIADGRVYLLDYDEDAGADALRCLSLDSGAELWRRWYEVRVKRNHGLSRTVPAVSGGYVVTIGPRCHVMCADAVTGDFKWGLDLVRAYGATVPGWYTGQCPLIDGGLAILAAGGTNALMLGVDCATGETVWETPNPHGWTMSHSSIMPMTFGGRRMYVYMAIGGMAGVAADGEDRGRVLWETSAWKPTVVAPSPVILGDGRIFMTAGYGSGSTLIRISVQDGTFTAQHLQILQPKDGLASEQQTPIHYLGHLYGILPKDAGPMRKEFVCYHPQDVSKAVWSSGAAHRFGLGPYAVIDGKFLLLDEDGTLHLIEGRTDRFVLLASHKVFDGHDAWGPLAVAQGLVLMRDSTRLFCVDLRGQNKLNYTQRHK